MPLRPLTKRPLEKERKFNPRVCRLSANALAIAGLLRKVSQMITGKSALPNEVSPLDRFPRNFAGSSYKSTAIASGHTPLSAKILRLSFVAGSNA